MRHQSVFSCIDMRDLPQHKGRVLWALVSYWFGVVWCFAYLYLHTVFFSSFLRRVAHDMLSKKFAAGRQEVVRDSRTARLVEWPLSLTLYGNRCVETIEKTTASLVSAVVILYRSVCGC